MRSRTCGLVLTLLSPFLSRGLRCGVFVHRFRQDIRGTLCRQSISGLSRGRDDAVSTLHAFSLDQWLSLGSGIAFFLSCFYRRGELLFRIGIFVSASSMAGAFGGLLATGLA